jgi:hypothetical protein
MPEIEFDREALRQLEALEADPTKGRLAKAVNELLDLLETDPGDRRLRRHRFQSPPLWHVRVDSEKETWSILWEPHPHEPDAVIVHYLGPTSFR